MFVTLTGDNTIIKGKTYVYITSSVQSAITSKGFYTGMMFGSDRMSGADYTMFVYLGDNNSSPFQVNDCWSDPRNAEIVQLDSSFGSATDNSVVMVDNAYIKNLDSTKFNGYTAVLIYEWTKNVAIVDKYDWSDAKNWATNNGKTVGAAGYFSGQKMLEHFDYSYSSRFTDGSNVGITSSFASNSSGFYITSILILLINIILY